MEECLDYKLTTSEIMQSKYVCKNFYKILVLFLNKVILGNSQIPLRENCSHKAVMIARSNIRCALRR